MPTPDFRTVEGDDLIRWAGYRVVGYDDRKEFPIGTVAVRISGPAMPSIGLPFPVPEDCKEIWARRWLLALSAARRDGAYSNATSN